MIVLAFDCASGQCAVSLLDGQHTHTRIDQCQRGQSELLVPTIKALVRRAGIGFDRIERIAVTTGPGSFTGVRVGLAAAHGLSLALGVPVIGIDSFTAFDATLALPRQDGMTRIVVIESRRTEVYWRIMNTQGPARCDAPADIVAQLPAGAILVGGDGAGHLAGLRDDLIVEAQIPGPDVEALAHMALSAPIRDGMPDPVYIRPPDAKPPARR